MAFIPMPECAMFEVFLTANGQSMENVYHLQWDAPFDEAALLDAIGTIQAWLSLSWAPIVGAGISCVGIKGTALDDDSAVTATATLGEPITGELAEQLIPMSSNAVISWRTGLRGRSYRGRTYHVGITEPQQEAGELTTTALASITTCYQAFRTAIGATPYSHVIVSRYHNKVARTTGVANLVSGMVVRGALRSQRRRNVGIGA